MSKTTILSRRHFNWALAGAAATPLVGALDAQAAATEVGFTAYAIPTQSHPILALGNWPLDHTAVATSTGIQWGCFGRTYKEDPAEAKVIATGRGDELWARAIAGPDGHAGIEYGVNGVSDQCCNRILLPAGIDVRDSPGNEIATLLGGVYGMGLEDLITRVEDGAAAVNKEHPGRISDAAVHAVVARVGAGLEGELPIVDANMERLIKPAVGARFAALKEDIQYVYLSFYYKRTALYHAYKRGSIGKSTLVPLLREAFGLSLDDLQDVIGPESYSKIVPVPPKVASDYMFNKNK